MDITHDCIEWDGVLSHNGYGLVSVKEPAGWQSRRVHRLVWAEVYGPIPKGMLVLHRCDNPPCFNVDHLFLGTTADNMRDRDAKGRNARGETHHHKLSAVDVWTIRDRLAQGDIAERIAKDFSVSPNMVANIKYGRAWASLTERP